jgi:hypothetical protein
MKKVKLPKFLILNLSSVTGYLTKMEILLIFFLLITSVYAVKMEMLLAETRPIIPTATLIGKVVIQPNSGIVKQSTMMFEKKLPETEHKNIQNFIVQTQAPTKYYEKGITSVLDISHNFLWL